MTKKIYLVIASLLISTFNASAQERINDLETCSTHQFQDEDFYYRLNPRSKFSEQSFLWKLTHPETKKESYIFGNIHSDERDVLRKVREILPLLSLVDGYISEVTHEPGLDLGSLLNSEISISSQLHSSILPLYQNILEERKLSFNQFDSFPLWFNFSQLSRSMVSKFNTDKLFVDEALTIQKYLGGFETNNELVNQLNKLSQEYQLKVLEEVICNIDLVSKQNEMMITNYLKNDVSNAYLSGHQYHTSDLSLYKSFMETIVFDRNLKMINALQEITKNRSVLSVVGYSHLIGERGIIHMLKQRGFLLEPISKSKLQSITSDIKSLAKKDIRDFYLKKFNSFLNKSSKYQIPTDSQKLPNIKFVAQSELQDLACEGTPCPMLGLYDSNLLRLAKSLLPAILGRNYQQVGILFHEYVHFVQEEYGDFQNVSEQTPLDWSLREKEANLLQLKFVHWMRTGAQL